MSRPTRLAALLCALFALACGGRSGAPREVPSPRVVSLAPSLTALVQDLGRGAHLVGVTRYCPNDGSIPLVGDLRPDLERILAQRPDLLVAGAYAHTEPALAALRPSVPEVVAYPLLTIADLRAATLDLGRRLDAAAPAAALVARLDAALAAAHAAGRARTGAPPAVLLVYDVSGGHVYTTGGGDHIAPLVTALGARNVAAGAPVTARLPLEEVVRLAPDVIIHVSPSGRFPDDAAARAFWAAVHGLPPATLERVHVWPDEGLTLLGPGLPGAIEHLTALLGEPP